MIESSMHSTESHKAPPIHESLGITARFKIPKRLHNKDDDDAKNTSTSSTQSQPQEHSELLSTITDHHHSIENYQRVEHHFDASNTQEAIIGLVPGILPAKVCFCFTSIS
jgi:hypothetical protein